MCCWLTATNIKSLIFCPRCTLRIKFTSALLRKYSLIPTQAVHFFWHLSFFRCLIPPHLPPSNTVCLQRLVSSWKNMVSNSLSRAFTFFFFMNWGRMKRLLTKLYCEIGNCKSLFNIYTHIFFMAVCIFSSHIYLYSLHTYFMHIARL